MRDLLLSSTLLLAACAAATPNEAAPVRGGGGDSGGGEKICDASNTSQFIGQTATAETQAAIQSATNSASVRVVRPDEMVTMEFSAGRVTVHVDGANKVIRIVCG